MRRDLFALLCSLLVHVILLLLFLPLWSEKPKQNPAPKRTSLQNLKILNDTLTTPSHPHQTPKITGNQTLPAPPPNANRESTNTPKIKTQKKPKSPQITMPKRAQNSKNPALVPLQNIKPPKEAQTPNIYDLSNRFENSDIKELYGDEFFTLSEQEQEFVEEHLRQIGQITQRYLKYPQIAGELGEEGINALEFYLHPNGDISDLRLIHSTGYTILDKNSLATIKIAYKDYPRPKSTTKIRIKVHYHIIGR
ncbi:MAG: TonB family protein [Wolinella sp.]